MWFMSIQAFSEFLNSNSEAALKVVASASFDDIAEIANTNGFNVTSDELSRHAAKMTSELSDDILEAISGGVHNHEANTSNPLMIAAINIPIGHK